MTVDLAVLLSALAQLAVLIAAIAAGVVWLRKWLRKQVAEPLESVRHEVTVSPTWGAQGDTMHDAVGRVEHKLDALLARFEDHLRWGHGGRGR